MATLYASTSLIAHAEGRLGELPLDRIAGIEAGYLTGEPALEAVRRLCQDRGLGLGTHTPALRGREHFVKWLPPVANRDLGPALERMALHCALSARAGAHYAVVHLPGRLPHPEEVDDLGGWIGLQTEAIRAAGAALVRLGRAHGLAIHVEVDGPHPACATGAEFARFFERFPELAACLDFYKLFLLNRWFADRSVRGFVEALAPHTASLHLVNTNYRWAMSGLRLPPHPSQRPADGWIDTARVIDACLRENPDLQLTLEHCAGPLELRYYAERGLDPDRYLAESIAWLEDLCGGFAGRAAQGPKRTISASSRSPRWSQA